jgi:HPt (histidine-containing phosphotransfer) domain-containing protein
MTAEAGGTGSPEVEALDVATVDALRAMKRPGAASLFERVFEAYRGSAPGLIDAMRRAAEAGDQAAFAVASHSLKSSSGNIGAARLAALCRALEQAARAGAVTDPAGKVAEIKRAYADALAALERIREADAAPGR